MNTLMKDLKKINVLITNLTFVKKHSCMQKDLETNKEKQFYF